MAVPPLALLAELTHRCPLRCACCANPRALVAPDEEMTTATWCEVFDQAAQLGILHVHLSGGEPLMREDLEALIVCAAASDLYTSLVTSGWALDSARAARLVDAGLDHVQLGFQAAHAPLADLLAGTPGGHRAKVQAAREVRAVGLPLSLHLVIHRHNIGELDAMVDLAVWLGALRLEIVHLCPRGWALDNLHLFAPTPEQLDSARKTLERRRRDIGKELILDEVHADACPDLWALGVSPQGWVMPAWPGLGCWPSGFPRNVQERGLAEIWREVGDLERLHDGLEPPPPAMFSRLPGEPELPRQVAYRHHPLPLPHAPLAGPLQA